MIKIWEATWGIRFFYPVEIPAEGNRTTVMISIGYQGRNYWPFEEDFKPNANKILPIIELWTRCKQNSLSLNEWITNVFNLAEICACGDCKDRIIRDVLITGCTSEKSMDKNVIGIIQVEVCTLTTLQELKSSMR